MSKVVNVTRDVESRARMAQQIPSPLPEVQIPQIVEPETETPEPQQTEDDAQSAEEVRPQADQSPGPAAKPKKTGRTPKRDPKTV